jgi:TRAP-type C4-dicarboxylate transport system permease small subunit
MDLLTPGIGLIVWQLIIFANILLIAISWIYIIKRGYQLTPKLLMILLTILIPIAGALICLVMVNNRDKKFRPRA